MKIDSWDSEHAYLKVDSSVKSTYTFTSSSGSENICGLSTYNDLAQVIDSNFTHSATTMTIEITTDLNELSYSESFGIKNLFILVDYVNL